jgi:hypothetical protein
VAYYDDVSISLNTGAGDCPNTTTGCFAETVSGTNAGAATFTTTYHSPDGQITTPAAAAVAPTNATFHRRWIIEANTPINGVQRVTVQVTPNDTSLHLPPFQMSMVRP